MKKSIILPFLLLFFSLNIYAQGLKPGFNAFECEDIFKLNFAFLDTSRSNKFTGFLEGYDIYYRTPAVGLDNSSDIWIRKDSVVVIMLRGTTGKIESFLEDFYCAMIPAQGSIKLNNNESFAYRLASDPRAAVHAGFLIGFAFLAHDIRPVIEDLYNKGYHQFIVGGHSQGGSLSYFMSAWLWQLKKEDVLKNIKIKTYASAPPKPGNMYFAYDYDNTNLSEWSFSIVNTVDPVPEMPFTTQQIDIDMNEPNPILNLMDRFNEMPFLQRIVLKHAFNKMRKKARQSSEAYRKYLGKYVGNFIHKSLPEMVLPTSVPTTYFVRPGVPITLSANKAYNDYTRNTPKYFNHGIDPYRFLLRQYFTRLPPFEPMAAEQ